MTRDRDWARVRVTVTAVSTITSSYGLLVLSSLTISIMMMPYSYASLSNLSVVLTAVGSLGEPRSLYAVTSFRGGI